MARRKPPRPTDAELAILRVLWERGPSTVREVQEKLNHARRTGYTTVLKLLQIMTEKGLVRRDDTDRAHVYEARLTAEQTQEQLVRHLLERAFGGARDKLVMQALRARGKPLPPDQLDELVKLLEQLKGDARR